MVHQTSDHCCHGEESQPKLGRNLKIVIAVFLAAVVLSFVPALEPFRHSLFGYISIIWWAVLLGLVLGGVIDYFVPDGFIMRFLGTGQRGSLFYAVGAGFLMSACSHGILAIAMQLYKKGAGTPAVITFLLASPWANLPVTILLFSFFGWKALLFIGTAMGIALVTGSLYTLLAEANLVESNSSNGEPQPVSWHRLRNFELKPAVKGVWAGSVSLANMVLWWILIGVLIAALLGAYVPQNFYQSYLGPDVSGLLGTLLVATVIEVCSEGTAPIAFEIYDKVGALGNPFVFLMAGVVTDYTEIGLIWSNIGRRAAFWLPIIAVPQVMIVAMMFNALL